MSATAIKARHVDAMRGAWIELGTFTVTPGVISQNSDLEVQIDGNLSCNTGDSIFVNPINLTVGEVCKGARATANGVGKVLLRNVTGANITDSTATVYDYQLIHYS